MSRGKLGDLSLHSSLLPEYAVLFVKPLALAEKIAITFWRLCLIRNRPDPFAKRRKPDAKIRRNLTRCQAAGVRDANRILEELVAVCRCHILSSLMRASLSEDWNGTCAGPYL